MKITPLGKIKKGIPKFKTKKVTLCNRIEVRKQAKHSPFGKAIIDVMGTDLKDDEDLQKYLDVRNAFVLFLKGNSSNKIYTMIELENMIDLFKRDMVKIVKKLLEGKKLHPEEHERMDKLFDHLEKLHKLKYGEKKIIEKRDFTWLRELTPTKEKIIISTDNADL